jgi:GxxExxY protein
VCGPNKIFQPHAFAYWRETGFALCVFAPWRENAYPFAAWRENGPMTENEIAREIVDAAYKVHTTLGPGLLESVYEAVLAYELETRGLEAARQCAIPIAYGRIKFEEGFRADLIVADKVIVELKSVENIIPVHKKQLLTYLRLADKRLGLLINFGANLIKDGITRIVNGLEE